MLAVKILILLLLLKKMYSVQEDLRTDGCVKKKVYVSWTSAILSIS